MRNQDPIELSVVVGQSVELPCDVEAYPPPRIMWQKGASILAEFPETIQSSNSSMFIFCCMVWIIQYIRTIHTLHIDEYAVNLRSTFCPVTLKLSDNFLHELFP